MVSSHYYDDYCDIANFVKAALVETTPAVSDRSALAETNSTSIHRADATSSRPRVCPRWFVKGGDIFHH